MDKRIMSKYSQLQGKFNAVEQLDVGLEKKYQENLEQQVTQYEQFHKIAQTHVKELDLKESIVGASFANDKVPFNIERGDTIGISLANSYASTQISQSEDYIKSLEARSSELSRQLEKKIDIDRKLEIFISDMEQRLDTMGDGAKKDEVLQLEDELEDEKRRYRELRKFFRQLVQDYS